MMVITIWVVGLKKPQKMQVNNTHNKSLQRTANAAVEVRRYTYK